MDLYCRRLSFSGPAVSLGLSPESQKRPVYWSEGMAQNSGHIVHSFGLASVAPLLISSLLPGPPCRLLGERLPGECTSNKKRRQECRPYGPYFSSRLCTA